MRGTKARSAQARAAIYRARLRREVAESLAQPKPKMTEAEAFKGFTDEDGFTPCPYCGGDVCKSDDSPTAPWCSRQCEKNDCMADHQDIIDDLVEREEIEEQNEARLDAPERWSRNKEDK